MNLTLLTHYLSIPMESVPVGFVMHPSLTLAAALPGGVIISIFSRGNQGSEDA